MSGTSSLPGAEDIAVRRLENGMVLAARESWAMPSLVLNGSFEVGGMDDPDGKSGLASLTATLLSRGTAQRNYEAINEGIEGVGASLGFGSGTHTTSVGVSALTEDAPRLIELLAELLQQPAFPTEHVERVRQQRLAVLADRAADSGALANRTFYENAYPPGHPYHRSPLGDLESVAAISREEIAAFHAAHYGPTDGLLVMVGAIPREAALDLLEGAFAGWKPVSIGRGRTTAPEVTPRAERLERRRTLPGKSQSDLVYGLPAIARTHPDFLTLRLANTVLGVFGMMGRIGRAVRDEKGLAYSARSAVGGGRGPGAWVARAGVAPDQVATAVAAIRREWERLGKELVPDAELADSRALLINSLPLSLESNGGVAATIHNILSYDLGLDYLSRYRGLIEKVTAEEVRAVSARYFDADRAILAVVGPPVVA